MTLPYTHLTLAERREIYRLLSAQIPVAVIAKRLDRHPSTIYREISRNWMHDEEPLYQGYFHVAADMQARARTAPEQAFPPSRSGRSCDRVSQGGLVA
jgi:IS30 family transposase